MRAGGQTDRYGEAKKALFASHANAPKTNNIYQPI